MEKSFITSSLGNIVGWVWLAVITAVMANCVLVSEWLINAIGLTSTLPSWSDELLTIIVVVPGFTFAVFILQGRIISHYASAFDVEVPETTICGPPAQSFARRKWKKLASCSRLTVPMLNKRRSLQVNEIREDAANSEDNGIA